MNNQKTEQTAQQNAKLKVEFRIHMVTYIAVNSLLAIINLTLTPGYLWFIWPLMGWGLGIILHGINVYLSTKSSLKERMIQKQLKKEIH
jgi:hypothetical protein